MIVIMGRPRKKDRLPNLPYNISVETHDRLDNMRKKGETQDGFIKRLILENEEIPLLRSDLDAMKYLRDDAWKTNKEIRESKLVLENKFRELRQFQGLIRSKPWAEYTILPWVF